MQYFNEFSNRSLQMYFHLCFYRLLHKARQYVILLFSVTVNYSSLIQITHYIYFLIVTMRVSSSNHSLNSLCYLIGGHSLATTQRKFAKPSKKSLKFE